jgi:hypothetical protein
MSTASLYHQPQAQRPFTAARGGFVSRPNTWGNRGSESL